MSLSPPGWFGRVTHIQIYSTCRVLRWAVSKAQGLCLPWALEGRVNGSLGIVLGMCGGVGVKTPSTLLSVIKFGTTCYI